MNLRKKLGEEKYAALLNNSLGNIGNNYRIKKAFAREEITAVFIGGSITYGYNPACTKITPNFAELVSKQLEGMCKIKKCNSKIYGAAGTASLMGMLLTEQYVRLDKPNIVIVEYAVNEGKSPEGMAMFEGLIRKLVRLKSQPAVIIVDVMGKDYYSCDDFMKPIGEHYNLPVITLAQSLKPSIEIGEVEWSDYSNDNVHPVYDGHELIADSICQYLEKALSACEDNPYEMPETVFFSSEYEDMQFNDFSHTATFKSDFLPCEENIYPFGRVMKKERNDGVLCLEVNLKCKMFALVFVQNNSNEWGTADIYFDGDKIGTAQGYSIFGWNNAVVKNFPIDKVKDDHVITVKMTKGDEHKHFAAVGFAWC